MGAPAGIGGLPGPAGASYSRHVGVLLERERELDGLARALSSAVAGTGSGIAVSGEPGAGKSALVEAAAAGSGGLRILRGRCDPLATPRPLGPFRDLSADLGGIDPDASLAAVCEATYEALRAEPSVLIVEDIHWVDAATVDVLRFLVRRVEAMPCVVLVTYRDDEIAPQHPARPLLGDFAALDQLRTLRLAPLSVTAVSTLLATGADEARRVHEVTGGNAFFVAEVAKEPDRPLPANVRDAILARTSGVAADDFEVLQLAAAAPNRLDDRVLPALAVDLPTLRRLYDTGLLLRDRHGLVFRHELARLAVESTIPAGGAARLHARLLDALEQIAPPDPAVLTHHAVAAGDAIRAARYAQDAAQQAARAGSHTEAIAFLQIALAHLRGASAVDRARLQLQLGHEQYMTSHLALAIASIEATFPLWRTGGDLRGLSAAHESCAVFEYYNARRPEAEQHAAWALDLARDGSGLEYGSARVTNAYLAYHQSRYEDSAALSEDGTRIAKDLGDHALDLRGQLVGAVSDLARQVDGARERCLDITEQARAAGLDELASTAYSNVSYLDVEQTRFSAAERLLEISLPYTVERDIPICNRWQTAVRSRLRFREGRWSAALEDAADALEEAGMPLAAFWPLLVRSQVALRQNGSGRDHLEAAWRMVGRLDEPLRTLPALTACAERMWLTGTDDERVTTALPALLSWADAPALRWSLGELVVWLRRLDIDPAISAEELAEPHRLTIAGRHAEAAAWWHRTGAVFEEAMASTDAADIGLRLQGLEKLDLLGATATSDRLRRDLRQQGVQQLPTRPRVSTRANPAGLTNRQLDVAKLVARGHTNAEIADRLFISPRTTDHHVSAVLTKLGMPSRRAVVVQAADLGLA